ncbi:MAG TPA: metal-dependent hydrolase [Sediminibacterium sp.]|nr:metal-dependent hydrolase [Sediminibacterium sp.]
MDSFTHLALGACMGEAFAGKKLGKKAMLWGAMAQSIPDIDFVSAFWMETSDNLLAHRGFTHSFLFCAILAPLLALLAEKLHRPHNIRFGSWVAFFGMAIFLHNFIDAFNNYGVGWFEPFSHYRVSFNAIYVADPLFSIWSLIACLVLLYLGRRSALRKNWWRFGLGMSAVYLLYCLFNKYQTDQEIRQAFKAQKVSYTRYLSTPAPLQNWLWYVVAGTDTGYYVGFRSVFDTSKQMDLAFFPRNDSLLKEVHDHRDVDQLIRFSQQFYTVEKWGDTLVFNDLRFGQMLGWQSGRGRFVFHFFLNHRNDNKLVVQRGRFKGWNLETAESLMQRIRGN